MATTTTGPASRPRAATRATARKPGFWENQWQAAAAYGCSASSSSSPSSLVIVLLG